MKTNVVAIIVGLFGFIAYGGLDYSLWGAQSLVPILARVITSLIGLGLLALLFVPRMTKSHEALTAIVAGSVGATINFIIYYSGELSHAYYVALIQVSIFVCCLVRIGFVKSIAVMATLIAGFIVAAFPHGQTEEATLQLFILLSMGVVIAFSSYFLQRYRRIDFIKTQIINDQNMQLRGLLKDIQDDHDRKIAAMNMLVHFVRTPLHQISGFSDVVLQTLARRTGDEALSAGLDGARYIKNASMDLTENVNRLLTYHRLDEYELSDEGEPVNIVDALSDYLETFEPRISFEKPEAAHTINVNRDVLDVAFQSFAVYYSEAERPVTSIKISFHVQGDAVGIIFKDDGPPIDNDDFENLTKPLTKIDKYLDVSVAKMPMLLRTVARAAELLGGGLVCGDVDDNCVFMLHMRDGASTQATDIKRNFTLAAELLPQDIAWNTATGA